MIPLFDRLYDKSPPSFYTPPLEEGLTETQLLESLIHEIEWLLNTRSSVTLEDYEYLQPETLTYGIPILFGLPDFSFFQGEDKLTWQQGERYIHTALRLFEPRLLQPVVEITSFHAGQQALEVLITGHMHHQNRHIPVRIPMHVMI